MAGFRLIQLEKSWGAEEIKEDEMLIEYFKCDTGWRLLIGPRGQKFYKNIVAREFETEKNEVVADESASEN